MTDDDECHDSFIYDALSHRSSFLLGHRRAALQHLSYQQFFELKQATSLVEGRREAAGKAGNRCC